MLSLVQNEWIKIFKRPGTIVMIALLLIGILVIGGFEKKNAPSTNSDAWKQASAETIKNNQKRLKESKIEDKDYKESLEKNIALNQYGLDHNINPNGGSSVWSFVKTNLMLASLTGLFAIIIASSIVSSEYGWGTIKLLLTRSISRSKILLSKYLTVIAYSVFFLAILYIFSLLVGLVLFGTGEGAQAHLAYIDGKVVEQNIALYLAKTYLFTFIDAFVVATMAFMISAVFRNSNLATGLSLFVLFSGGLVTVFLAGRDYQWGKYLFFANTDLSMYENGETLFKGMSYGFSVTVLVVYLAIFLGLAFFVFKKRDVAA